MCVCLCVCVRDLSMYDCTRGCFYACACQLLTNICLALLLYRPKWVQGVWKLSVRYLALREHHRLLSLLHGLPAWPPRRRRHRLWWVVKPCIVRVNYVKKKQANFDASCLSVKANKRRMHCTEYFCTIFYSFTMWAVVENRGKCILKSSHSISNSAGLIFHAYSR